MRKVYKSNQILNEGTCLSCCERFGGNTLQCKWCNHLYVSLLKSIFVNAKILISSYKISNFAFTKIVLEQRYLEMIACLFSKILHCRMQALLFQDFESELVFFIAVIYPFIHLSGETKISKMNILPQNASDEEPSKEWVDQGFYVELEHISSKTSFSFKELNYVIFIGVQSHQDSLSSRLGK